MFVYCISAFLLIYFDYSAARMRMFETFFAPPALR